MLKYLGNKYIAALFSNVSLTVLKIMNTYEGLNLTEKLYQKLGIYLFSGAYIGPGCINA